MILSGERVLIYDLDIVKKKLQKMNNKEEQLQQHQSDCQNIYECCELAKIILADRIVNFAHLQQLFSSIIGNFFLFYFVFNPKKMPSLFTKKSTEVNKFKIKYNLAEQNHHLKKI